MRGIVFQQLAKRLSASVFNSFFNLYNATTWDSQSLFLKTWQNLDSLSNESILKGHARFFFKDNIVFNFMILKRRQFQGGDAVINTIFFNVYFVNQSQFTSSIAYSLFFWGGGGILSNTLNARGWLTFLVCFFRAEPRTTTKTLIHLLGANQWRTCMLEKSSPNTTCTSFKNVIYLSCLNLPVLKNVPFCGCCKLVWFNTF